MIIKENFIIIKNWQSKLFIAVSIIIMIALGWMFYETPKEFRNGIYPEINNIEKQMDELDKKMGKINELKNSIIPSCFIGNKTRKN